MSRKAKQAISYVALGVVLIGSAGLAYGAVSGSASSARSNSRTVTVLRGSISQTVSATGNLQPATPVNVNFQTSGTITEIDVTAGEQVTAGEVLARLDATQAVTNVAVAKLNLAAANAKLTQARSGSTSTGQGSSGSSGVTQAQLDADQVAVSDAQNAADVNAKGYQLDVDQAQSQLDTDKKQQADDEQECSSDPSSSACGRASQDQTAVDKDQNALATSKQKQAQGVQHDQQAIHTAQARRDVDQASFDAAQSSSTTTSGTVDQSAIDTAEAGVVQAQSALDTAQKAADATTLTASWGGTITAITRSVGDTVSSGSSSSAQNGSTSNGGTNATASAATTSTAAFTIADPNAFEVKVGFPESDAIKVKVGQQATTTLDALTGTTLSGSVTSVDATATVTSNVVTYNAVVSVTSPPSAAKSGMTANVTVTTVSKDNVLELATAAVQTQAGNSFVDKLVNGQTVPTDVTTGLQGDSNTEIVSGLSEGDEVVVTTGTLSSSPTGTRTGGGAGTFGGGAGGFGGGGGGFPGGGGGPN
jgi:multidrug efflux pump subunit AcrA (membrane-fusion protein)